MRMTAASCSSLIVSCAKVQFGHGFCKFSLQLVWYFCQSARIRGCRAAWSDREVAFEKGLEIAKSLSLVFPIISIPTTFPHN